MLTSPVPPPLQAAARCDSITLTPGQWLGLPAVTAATLYRHEDPALVRTHDSAERCGLSEYLLVLTCAVCALVSGRRFDLQPAGGEAEGPSPLALTAVPGPQWNCGKDPTRHCAGERHSFSSEFSRILPYEIPSVNEIQFGTNTFPNSGNIAKIILGSHIVILLGS